MHEGGFGCPSVGGTILNDAVTSSFALIAITQVPVPEHPPPLQPANVEPDEGLALSVTFVPGAYLLEHVPGHEIPAGLLLTLPEPDPPTATVSEGSKSNVAVTLESALIVTVHFPVPEQPAPLQPENVEPAPGLALSVTIVPD